MKTIKTNAEFASELVCIIPYVYWLNQIGKLEKVITCKGMKPFYYFCKNVEETYDYRTLDHSQSGLSKVPNDWLHHNAIRVFGKDMSELSEEQQSEANGVLDYTQWTPPPYAEYYKTSEFDNLKPYVVINNNYNIEFGNNITESIRFFNIEVLYKMFNYFTENGYKVIYKRPNNTEFSLDQNEMRTLHEKHNLTADVEGIGKMSDYDLCEHYDGNVININKIESDYSYNELQMKIFSGAEGFVTPNGGGGILCSCFDKPVVMYVPHGKELRDKYLTKENSYINRLSNNKVYPILDEGNKSNYKKVLNKIEEVFNETN